ncbi:MAG: hypothetical protein LPK14_14225, partial [Hymenobacteraceae bacterium]|nr:hypothetical protein [Hymenobacteraceae bacterium]
NYKQCLLQISKIVASHGYHLYVKPHPTQESFYKEYLVDHVAASIIDFDELHEKLAGNNIVIGFFSTLLLPLTALPHTTVLTLENHPAGRLNVSKSFIDAGVAHPIYDLEELHEVLPRIEEIHRKQLPNKAKFTEDWLYKFDWKSGERLRDILLSDDL